MVYRLPDGGPVRVRTSSTASEAPGTSELEEGELALNSSDGVLYFQTASDTAGQFPSAVGINAIVSITQAAYDALAVKDPSTLYVIT